MRYVIVTYCSADYVDCLRFSLPSWLDRGHADKILIYSDTNIDTGIQDRRIVIRQFFRPAKTKNEHYSRKAISISHGISGHDNLLMLDVDCLITNSPRQFFNRSFDIAPTLWGIDTNMVVTTGNFDGKPRKMWNDVSSGALFIRNTVCAKNFINRWMHFQGELVSGTRVSRNIDQISLTRTCKHTINAGDITLIAANSRVFNNYPGTRYSRDIARWMDRINVDTRILHFASGIWKNDEMVKNIVGLTNG